MALSECWLPLRQDLLSVVRVHAAPWPSDRRCAGPLFALSSCRTSVLQVQRLHAVRLQQAALAAHCHTHGLPDADGIPAAELDAVAAGLQALAAAGVSDLGDVVAGTLLPDIHRLQTSELRGRAWGYGLPGAAYEGLPVDVAIVDEAGCMPDYAMPSILSFMPSNLVRCPLSSTSGRRPVPD